MAHAAPASAQSKQQTKPKTPKKATERPRAVNPEAFDIYISVFSNGPGQDEVAVAYGENAQDARIKSDLADLARELGQPAPTVKVSREKDPIGDEVIATGSAKLQGLTNWSTGDINLDALIRTFRRYGHFQSMFLFTGNFPVKPVGEVVQPPIRVRSEQSKNEMMTAVTYEVWVDQSQGVPTTIPSVTARADRPWWPWVAGIAAVALVVGISVFLIVNVILAQRRSSPGEERS